ncbi:stabilin-2-like [Dreissena polymorpha]|uniref:stabilin-2-like n=1 Tax=Dreissena polymorpha TaxID=45954 RepID=UPI00226444B5|nr:stabilin-2-like [Dreissena polymorpha]
MFRYTLVVAAILLVNVLEWSHGVALDGTCTTAQNCTGTTPNSDCTGADGSKTCKCITGYTKQGTACKANLGTTCSNITDCDTITNPKSECTGSGTKSCTCATGYTQQETLCKADLGIVCTASTDCDTVTTTDAVCDLNADSKICAVGVDGDCSGSKSTKCPTSSTCVSNKCACSTGYTATTTKLCSKSGAEGLVNTMSMLVLLTSGIMVKIF